MNERLEQLRERWVWLMEKIKWRNKETSRFQDIADEIKAEIEELERVVTKSTTD